MKTIKIHFLVLALLILPFFLHSQPQSAALWWKASPHMDTLNFHSMYNVRTHGELMFNVPRGTHRNEVVVVYTVDSTDGEEGVWQLSSDDGARVGLTTHRILNEYGDFHYDMPVRRQGTIHYLSQTWVEDSASDTLTLTVGKVDSLQLHGCVGEVLFFNDILADTALTQWISYLAIRYGITLQWTDYLNSAGDCIWLQDTLTGMSGHIAGIGRDDAFGLWQWRSNFADGRYVFAFEDSSALLNQQFVIFGTDSLPSAIVTDFIFCSDSIWDASARTLVQVSGERTSLQRSSLTLCDSILNACEIPPLLLIDRSGTWDFDGQQTEWFHPSGRDSSGRLVFTGLKWDTDMNGRDCFCFVRSSMLAARSSVSTNDGTMSLSATSSGVTEYLLYPNPSSGEYTLSISYPDCTDVSVRIFTIDGRLLRAFSDGGKNEYFFRGRIDGKGNYILDIESSIERKHIKMIVN